jgi:hypothetical protein
LLNWLRDDTSRQGPRGRISFAVSVRMTPKLKKCILRLTDSMWKPYREDSQTESECADVLNYWPEEEDRPDGAGPLRYTAICIRPRQGELFADGSEAKYFAVASNEWKWEPRKLLEWHREKAGTIEAIHDVLKNELAGGVMPCGRFGANAAWIRLALMTHNVLTTLKRIGLPEPWLRARPKRLRFRIFCSPAKLVHHARRPSVAAARPSRQRAIDGVDSGLGTHARSGLTSAYGRIIRRRFPEPRGRVAVGASESPECSHIEPLYLKFTTILPQAPSFDPSQCPRSLARLPSPPATRGLHQLRTDYGRVLPAFKVPYHNGYNGLSGTTQQFANQTFQNWNNGVTGTANRFGNQTFYNWNNGTNATQQRIGNQTFTHYNDGTNCTTQRIGSQAFSNCY